jgi:hypothetical protein
MTILSIIPNGASNKDIRDTINSMLARATALESASGGSGSTAFSMTQLSSAKRVYQRSTTSGGGQGKGSGTVKVNLNVTVAGPVYARCRSSDGSTILQASYKAINSTPVANGPVAIPSVDARLGWFYLDLSPDGTNWQNGTVLIGMGRLVAMSGQSQAVRQFGKMPSYSGTNASLSVNIEANSSMYARYTDSSRTVSTAAWATPADSSNYDSTFAAEFLRRQVGSFGVNCAIVGHAVGSTNIASWQPGQQNNTDLRGVLDAVEGFEAFYWHQGGDDAGAGTSAASYQSGLSAIFSDVASRNSVRGASFEKYVTTMATRTSGGAGNTASVQTIRKAAYDWTASNSASYLEPHDVNLEDAVHQGQPGNIVLARHLHRATTAATDNGPTLSSGSRSGATITLVASSAVTLVGSVTDRFSVYASGTTASALAISSVTVSGTAITITLSADPAQAVDVYWLRHPDPSGSTAASNMIYDTYTADGLPNGRQLQPTISAAIAIASTSTPAPSPTPSTPTPTPTPTGSPRDNFTDTSGVNLTAHTSDSGHSWIADTGTMLIGPEGVYPTANPALYRMNYNPASADYSVSGILRARGSSASPSAYLELRAQAGQNTYVAGWRGGGFGWHIGKIVNGTFTQIANTVANITDGTDYPMTFSISGSTLTLTIGGVTVTGTDTTFTDKGQAGIRFSGNTGSPTVGWQVDNFAVTG